MGGGFYKIKATMPEVTHGTLVSPIKTSAHKQKYGITKLQNGLKMILVSNRLET